MIFTREKLTDEFCNIAAFMDENAELVLELYNKALMLNLDAPETGAESHGIFCTIVAVCLLSNEEDPKYPLSYEEEDLQRIAEVAEGVDFLVTLQSMVNNGSIIESKIDGRIHYTTAPEKIANGNKKARKSKTSSKKKKK